MNPQQRVPSGFFTTPNNTPSGKPMVIAVDNPYLTKDEFITTEGAIGLGLTALSPLYVSGRLDRILLSASGQVNRYCRRWFDTQTIDETKNGITIRPINPQLVTNVLQNRPYQKINTIYIQVLKWFIQILTTGPDSYLQDFPDKGLYKIVPLLSNSGTGAGSPMPAEIVDKTPLGVLWTNYTFGYGKDLTGITCPQMGALTDLKTYQAPLYNRLFAPSQTINVYVNSVLADPSTYSITDYPNGIIVFNNANPGGAVVTADYTTNETIPVDIKEAVILLATYMIGQGTQNALGAQSYSIQTYSVSWGGKNSTKDRFEEILHPYSNTLPVFI
jgi:hypothetical protein